MEVKEYITISLAAVGAVLGVLNTWRAFDRDRPKLRLRPTQAFIVGFGSTDAPFLSFDITNLSSFPLIIKEVGVLYWWSRKRGVIIRSAAIHGGENLPVKLESRASCSVFAAPGALSNPRYSIRCAYVKTACGVMVTATSPAFRQLVREAC